MTLVYVGLGGALGSLTRFHMGKFINERYARHIPLGTLVINITGAILLGYVVTVGKSQSIQLFLADGFLGAYTTFSTFMYEGYTLIQEGEQKNAIKYLLFSIFIGIVGFYLGTKLGHFILK